MSVLINADALFFHVFFLFIIQLSHLLLSNASAPWTEVQSTWNLNTSLRIISVLIFTFFWKSDGSQN